MMKRSHRKRFEDATLLALKMKGGAACQGMQVASRIWKRHGNGFSPRASRRNAVLRAS